MSLKNYVANVKAENVKVAESNIRENVKLLVDSSLDYFNNNPESFMYVFYNEFWSSNGYSETKEYKEGIAKVNSEFGGKYYAEYYYSDGSYFPSSEIHVYNFELVNDEFIDEGLRYLLSAYDNNLSLANIYAVSYDNKKAYIISRILGKVCAKILFDRVIKYATENGLTYENGRLFIA